MSAPDKEPQPLGSTSGKRGYIRTCVRCGILLAALAAVLLALAAWYIRQMCALARVVDSIRP